MTARPRKKRAPSKGPTKRAGGNHGNGKGRAFRSVTLMLKTILLDKREALYKNLAELCEKPAGALKFAELAGDRIEGKPIQRLQHRTARQTIFQRDPSQPPLQAEREAPAPQNGALC